MKLNKYIFLLIVFIGCLFLSNVISLIISRLFDVPLENILSGSEVEYEYQLYITKLIIATSHLFTFILTSLLFIYWNKKTPFCDYLSLSKIPQITVLTICIAILLTSYPLLAYTTIIESWFEIPDWAKSMDENAMDKLKTVLHMENPIDLIINLIIISIIPAIGEEFLFRGVLQKEIITSIKSYHLSIWIVAIIFSAFHLQIEGFLPKMLLGLIFGYSYYYTKNLWYPILLHLINNGMLVIGLYVSEEQLTDQIDTPKPEIHWSLALISLLLLVVSLIYAKKNEKMN